MAVKTATSNVQTAATRQSFTTSSVASRDGTTIGYYQIGRGPGLVILHGSVESGQSHRELAEALSDRFTVYLPDRRGRGLSGPYRNDHSLQTDVEDMEALLTKTGARRVIGISSGAVIWLRAALSLSTIEKAVIFEPPLSIKDSISFDFVTRFDQEIAQGKIAAALTTGMLGAQMGPSFLQYLPRWLLERMTTTMMNAQEKSAGPNDSTMKRLAPTLHYDFLVAKELSQQVDSLKNIQTDVLLLGGDKSPDYLKTSVRVLETMLPHARRVEIPNAGHEVTGNADQRGQPQRVAEVLRGFLA